MRREETKTVRGVMKMFIEGKRGRGRPKKRWLDTIKNDMRAVGEWCVLRECEKSR